jgi:hypothetical protein
VGSYVQELADIAKHLSGKAPQEISIPKRKRLAWRAMKNLKK